MNSNSTQNNSIKFWRNRDFCFLKFCVLFLLLPNFCISQIYVSGGAKIYDSENSIITSSYSEKSEIYIVKGTITSGLENQHSSVVYINLKNVKKIKPLIAEKKIHDSKNTKEKIVSGRKETQKQPTLVYKPLPVETNCVLQTGKINSVAPPNPDFKQKYGIIRDIIFGISSTISNKNEKMFSQENQSFILSLSAYRVRPPPAFFDA